jgi:hypothetical protein
MIPQNENIPPQTVPYISEPTSPPFPGACASSCTFAFMGGVSRTIGYGSNYGVHQFESSGAIPDLQAQTEQMSAQLVAYLAKMGISSDYMTYMVKKTGGDVTNLSMKQLQQLGIITPRWQTRWQITARSDGTGFYLDGISTDPWGTHDIAFDCPPKAPAGATPPTQPTGQAQPAQSSSPALTATFSLDPGGRANAQDLVGAVSGFVLELSGQYVPSFIPASHPATVVSNRLSATLNLPQGLVNALYDIPDVGLAFVFNPAAKLPMRLLKFEASLDGALLKSFAATCH